MVSVDDISDSRSRFADDSRSSFKNNDPCDPFYIHPSENPFLVLTSSLLDGKNYHPWARSIRMALISKNKFEFVDGSIKEPEPVDPRFYAWVKCNNLVVSWVQRALNSEIAQSVLWIDIAADLWVDLFDHFSQGDLLRISDLFQEFFSLNQVVFGNNSGIGSGFLTFTKDQYDALLNLLNEKGSSSLPNDSVVNNVSKVNLLSSAFDAAPFDASCIVLSCPIINSVHWIISSDATDHICCSLDLFSTYSKVHNKFVKPPNGQLASVNHIGCASMNDDWYSYMKAEAEAWEMKREKMRS